MSTPSTSSLRWWVCFSVAMAVMTFFSIVLLLVAVATAFQARRFYAEVVVRAMSRTLLWFARVRLEVRGTRPAPGRQVFYMPTHPSMIDVFLLTAMALPECRYFMSRSVRKYGPFAFIAWLMGVFFTPPQAQTAARVRLFQRAERRLRASGESVLGTPEGFVRPDGLGPFNRGVFHLAAQLRTPIIPMIIAFKPGDSPGLDFAPRPTTVIIHFLPEISTADWRIEDLDEHKEEVRAVFSRFIEELNPSPP